MQTEIKSALTELEILGKVQINSVASKSPAVKITKKIGSFDFSRLGAAERPNGEEYLQISLKALRRAGICTVKLLICADNAENKEFVFEASTNFTTDTFQLKIPVCALPNNLESGLYYYHFELEFGNFTLYTNSTNNVDFELTEEYPQKRFKLLIYEKNFKTPDWFCGNIMYHVFVDRFCRGKKSVPISPNAVINPDWENGVPQYGEYPGAFVKNNEFFGGTLWGVIEKLNYLQSLGVGCIYLSPIFKAYSNHKYDTGDYMTVDEMFGGEEALCALIKSAAEKNIKIILDGVFNHTGDNSLYFNRYGNYEGVGAYQSEDSPYRNWYFFDENGKYRSWWGIEILPKLNLNNQECKNFFLGKNGVLEKYFSLGIGGVRLDVADELPNGFLDGLRQVAKRQNPNAVIIGEVWENAADKIAYGERRKYFCGGQLDSVMNYPLKNAITEFINNKNSEFFFNAVTELYASYPKQCSDCLMNILGTHDTERILTVLGGDESDNLTNAELAHKRMTEPQRSAAIKRLKVASALQYTLFGVPSVYYGDEAGAEGYRDPFCRMPYPWEKEDAELLEHYKTLGRIRKNEYLFAKGGFEFLRISYGFVSYRRYDKQNEIIVMANTSENAEKCKIFGKYIDLATGKIQKTSVNVDGMSFRILKKYKEEKKQ